MKPDGDKRSKRMAEVLRLHLTEGKGIKAIARQLKLHRKTVRKLLGRARGERKGPPAQPRSSILDPYCCRAPRMRVRSRISRGLRDGEWPVRATTATA
jgi:hypothetical protein